MKEEESTGAINIPIDEKRKRLGELSEQDFRDKVVRTLFLALGYERAREHHGPDELGKDIIFTEKDKLEQTRLIAIQTKKGKITMAARASTNATNIVTQLRRALATPAPIPGEKIRKKPDEVMLCASGKINDRARDYINEELKDSRIRFLDAEDIISLVDDRCPEVWRGVTADVYSYFNAIKKQVESFDPEDIITTHVTDESYVELRLTRVFPVKKNVHGKGQYSQKMEELRESQIIENPKDMAILAEAGTGKSTLLWRLAYLMAKNPRPDRRLFPLILKAKDIKPKSILSTDDFISYCHQKAQEITREIKIDKSSFENGELWIMLDALDEIADVTRRTELIKFMVNKLKDEYAKIRILYTARPEEDIVETKIFNASYSIEKLSDNQAKKILERAIKKKGAISKSDEKFIIEQGKRVLRRIREIHGFELTPLLLNIFAYTAGYESRDIPANITELFKKFTEMMLDRWDRDRGFIQQYEYSLKDFLLKKIAYKMHEGQRTSIMVEEFRTLIQGELTSRGYTAEAEALYSEIVVRSGLLKTQEKRIEFSHHLLQEFFAGRGMENIDEVDDAKLDSDWWTKCFVFYFGEHPEGAHLLKKLQDEKGKNTPAKNKAVGLALQACFLSKTKIKWIIWKQLLSNIERGIIEEGNSDSAPFPILRFYQSFMYLKDALPLYLLRNEKSLNAIWPDWNQSEIRRFLVFSALMEYDRWDLIQNCPEEEKRFDKTYLSFAFLLNLYQQAQHNKDAQKLYSALAKDTRPLKEFKEEVIRIIKPKNKDASHDRKRLT